MQKNDREISESLKNPQLKAGVFNDLVSAYQKPIYFHIRRMVGNHSDADDVLQNTFLKIWKYAESFKGDSAIYTWMYRIASNEALTFLKKNKTFRTQEIQDHEHPQTSGRDISTQEIQQKLERALQTLPAKQRQVFDLKYFSELKYDEIAEITGTSTGALKASYFHAVKKIEEFLNEN